MSIATQYNETSQQLQILIVGDFDYSVYEAFTDSYKAPDHSVIQYLVDLTNVTYIDSTALGMLLLLREFAVNNSIEVSILGAPELIHDALHQGKFNKLFKIL